MQCSNSRDRSCLHLGPKVELRFHSFTINRLQQTPDTHTLPYDMLNTQEARRGSCDVFLLSVIREMGDEKYTGYEGENHPQWPWSLLILIQIPKSRTC